MKNRAVVRLALHLPLLLAAATYARPSPARADDRDTFALQQKWKSLQDRIRANTGISKDQESSRWQKGMLGECNAATDPSRCIREAYAKQIGDLKSQLYPRYLGQKVSADQILSAIHPRFEPVSGRTGQRTDINAGPAKKDADEMVVFFKIAELSFLPGHLVVLDALSDAVDGASARAYFTLVVADQGRLRVLGRETIIAGNGGATLAWQDQRSGTSLKFDLANYKINDSERAFGYRAATWDGGTGAEESEETLVLFRLAPEGLKKVFEASMESSDATWDNQEGKVYKDKKQRAVLVVKPTQHEGNYDWMLKGRIINNQSKKLKRLKSQTYIWKNGAYVPEGAGG